jgi:hypothetical protein
LLSALAEEIPRWSLLSLNLIMRVLSAVFASCLKMGFWWCANNVAEGFLRDGVQVIAVAKSSDVVLMVLDASKVHRHAKKLLAHGVRVV